MATTFKSSIFLKANGNAGIYIEQGEQTGLIIFDCRQAGKHWNL